MQRRGKGCAKFVGEFLYRGPPISLCKRLGRHVLRREQAVSRFVRQRCGTRKPSPGMYRPRVLGQWFDGIRFYAAASSPTRSRRI